MHNVANVHNRKVILLKGWSAQQMKFQCSYRYTYSMYIVIYTMAEDTSIAIIYSSAHFSGNIIQHVCVGVVCVQYHSITKPISRDVTFFTCFSFKKFFMRIICFIFFKNYTFCSLSIDHYKYITISPLSDCPIK